MMRSYLRPSDKPRVGPAMKTWDNVSTETDIRIYAFEEGSFKKKILYNFLLYDDHSTTQVGYLHGSLL